MYLEISNPMDYHVALYIRLSKEDENEGPSESVNNQKSLLDDFVKKHRLSVYDTYIDDGWSGTNFDRPDFQRMIGDIEAKKVNMVITKDLSRLGRDYIMTGHYMERYFLVNDDFVLLCGMHLITIDRFAADKLSLTLLIPLDGFDLLGNVLGIHVVHDGTERSNVIG